MANKYCSITLFCLSSLVTGVLSMNVGTNQRSVSVLSGKDGAPSSFFGYSISLGEQSLEIGAPLSSTLDNQNTTDKGGKISRCPLRDLVRNTTTAKACSDITPQPVKPGSAYGQTVYKSPKSLTVACSATKKQECTGVNYNPGYCYQSLNGGRTWNAGPKTSRIDCAQKLDLMIVLDGSGSISDDNFQKVKNWTIELASNFNIETQAAQIGVVQYSYYKSTRPEWNQIQTEVELGECRNQSCFQNGVSKIKQFKSQTFTAHALNKTVTDFQGSYRFYSSLTSKVLILLTDGRSSDGKYIRPSANYVRSFGITTFAVGVGHKINETELQVIANGGNGTNRVFNVANFDQLQAIVGQLKSEIFKLALEGGGNTSSVFYGQEMAETGFSIAGSKTTGRLVLGTVGAYDWSGTFTVYSSTTDLVPDIPDFEQVRSVLPLRPKESYLGYSVTTGFYEGPTIGEYIAGGAPRYVLEGAVVVYRPNTRDNNKNFTNSHTIRPPIDPQTMTRQLGSYFGGSLLSADLNGDGFDELLVGAPLYIGNNYDEGRVFVYVANGTDSVALWADPSYKPLELVGEHRPGGRFGTAMAVAGDLNQDGYNDVIIGAPLTEGDKGAIFVYHGSASGIDTTLKQVILASSLQGKNLQYFGQSLQGGVDLDGNRYPDVAVGAPKSDTVVIFRTRPVVKLTSRLTFSKTSVDILECFNTPNRQCVNLTSCLSYNGTSTETHLQILYNTTIDTTLNRIEFRTLANATTGDFVDSGSVNLTKNVEQCWTRLIYVKQNIRDYTSALTASMTYDLTPEHKALPLSSVRDPSIPNMVKTETEFSKKCGPDKVCSYDLQVAASITLPSKVYLPGTTVDLSNNGSTLVVTRDTYVQPVTVRVNVSNAGENAFDTRIHIDYTSALSWTVMEDIQSSNNYLPCVQEVSDLTRPNGKVLRYVHNTTLGSIMRENDWCSFVLRFSTNSLKTSGDVSPVDVSVLAQTAVGYENDTNKGDNKWNTTHNVLYTSAAELAKKLIPDEALFNFTDTNDTVVSVHEVGNGSADLTIQYEVKGLGFATIPVSTLSLSFPSKLNAYTHLLYPYQVDCIPSVSTRCTCDKTLVNPYHLSLDPPNENNTNGPNVTMYPYPVPFTAPVTFDCSSSSTNKSTCQTIMCNVYDLGELDKVTFTAKFRLWTKAFNFENLNDTSFKSSITHDTTPSKLMIFPDGSPTSIITKVIDFPVKKYYPPIPPEPQADLLWVYIVAAIAGLLLLIIIILIMWKTGFFKSKYADMKQEALEWNEANTNGAMDQSTEGMLES